MTTKILALTDALGNLADFCLLPGQAHDLRGVPELLEGLEAGYMLADRAFDADWLREALSEWKIAPVIPPRKNRKQPARYDEEMYKWRQIVAFFDHYNNRRCHENLENLTPADIDWVRDQQILKQREEIKRKTPLMFQIFW